MLGKRIIPCLDVRDGRVVKGVNFVDIRDAGDPVECARRYDLDGADEITFLDITASHEGRDIMLHTVERMASQVFIPLTVGGGVRSEEDFVALLRAGADKVSVNSSAVADPSLVDRLSAIAGAQALVHGHTHRPQEHRLPGGGRRVVLSDWDLDHGQRAEVMVWTAEGFERQMVPTAWAG